MSGPWERFADAPAAGPWAKFAPPDDARQELPADVQPSAAGGGRGRVNPEPVQPTPEPDRGPATEGDPMLRVTPSAAGAGANTFTVTDNTPRSVLDNAPPQDASGVATRRENFEPIRERGAEVKPTMRAPARSTVSEQIGAALQDAPLPARAAAKVVTGGAQALGGLTRAVGDFTGADGVAQFGAGAAERAGAMETAMGTAGPAEGFGPRSPVPYLQDMSEGAASSLGTAAALAGGIGAKGLTTAMGVMTAGQEYDNARNAGLSPVAALANATAKGYFERAGEKFQGLDRAASAIGTLMTQGATMQAKRTAGEELLRAGVREVPGELYTYLGQSATDVLPGIGANPDMTMGQFLDGLRDTAVQASMMGGAVGAGGAAVNRMPAKPLTVHEVARSKGFLLTPTEQEAAQIKRFTEAGDKAAAAYVQGKIDRRATEAEVEALAANSEAFQAPNFQQQYRALRIAGTKPAEAAARAGANTTFTRAAEAMNWKPAHIQMALEAAAKKPLEEVPGYLSRVTATAAQKGYGQLVEGVDVGRALEDAGESAMEAVMQSIYVDDTPAAVVDEIKAAEAELAAPVTEPVDSRETQTAPQIEPIAPPEDDIAPETAIVASPLDDAAHQAAASPLNDKPEPTKAQILAGNAALGHLKLGPLQVSVETPSGAWREDKANDPPKWRTQMSGVHYGYVRRTEAADSTEAKRQGVDIFIAEGTPEDYDGPVFVVDQVDKKGVFDEHKAVVGPATVPEAGALYLAQYEPGWTGLGAVTQFPSVKAFNAWVKDGKKTDPAAPSIPTKAAQAQPEPAPAAAEAPVQPAEGSAAVADAADAQGGDAALSPPEAPFVATMRDSGTLAIKGNQDAILAKLKAGGITKTMVMDGGIMVAKPQARKAQDILAGKPAEAPAAKPLKLGTTPGDADAVTVKDGVVHIGKYEAVDFDSGEPVKVPAGATDDQIKQALREAGALSRRQKFYGGTSPAANQDAEPAAAARPMDAEAFRRAFGPASKLTTAEVQKIVDARIADWTNGPKVIVVERPEDLPVKAPSDARGLYHGGKAYIVASRQMSANYAERTLAHEVIAHYGLRRILAPRDWDRFIKNTQLALASGNKPLNKLRDQVRRAYVNDDGEFNLKPRDEVEEIAAMAVEAAIDPKTGDFKPGFSWLKGVWARVAEFLRDMGFTVRFTATELQGMLVDAHKSLKRDEKAPRETSPTTAAAARDVTEAPPPKTESGEIESGQFARGDYSPSWTAPDETHSDKIIFEVQDSRIDLKRIQEAIAKAGRGISEKFDARMAESLYPGRVARRSEVFLKNEVKPLLEAMAREKVDMNELADYLHARHAPERNKQIAEINPDMPDGGAGKNSKGELMTDKAAADYLASLDPKRMETLYELAQKVDAITAGTRKLLVGEGLEKADIVDAWQGAYRHYVPLFRDEGESGVPHPQGMGFSVKGGASKRATGSTKQATNILAHLFMQREAAITRAEKNRVGLALYGLAITNPNPDFWTTIRPDMPAADIEAQLKRIGIDPKDAALGMGAAPTVRTVDPRTNKVVDRLNPAYKNLPGAIALRVEGEDRVLMFNVHHERALRLATSLKNLDGVTAIDWSVGVLHKYVWGAIPAEVSVGKATRWMAAVNTQYSPIFGIYNFIRDTQGAALNLGSTPLRGNSTKVFVNSFPAMVGIVQQLAGKEGGTWGKLFAQFQADGGQTGWRELFREASDRAEAIEKELQRLDTAGQLTAANAGRALLGLLDGFNIMLENSIRLSAYKAAIDKGLSRPAAAKLARELTVDFNRKGRTGRELSPLYAFLNASIQGTARTIETLKGPTGAAVIMGGLALGAIQAIALAAAGFDEDEIPEYVRTRSLIIPLFNEDKGYIAIPLSLGLHVLPNTGRVLAELVLHGGKEWTGKVGSAISEIVAAFSPFGGGNIFEADGALRTVAPTIIDPLIELGFNRNFAGKTIEKEPPRGQADNRPGPARVRESTARSLTGQGYLGISKVINKMTGGNDYEAGVLSPTPERLQYMVQTVGGGVVRELEKSINTSAKAATGEKIRPTDVPLFGRLYGTVDSDLAEQAKFYRTGEKLDKVQSALKAAETAGNVEAMKSIIERHPEVILAQAHDQVQREISLLNKAAVATVGDVSRQAKIDDARYAQMRAFNAAMRRLEEKTKEPTLAEKMKPKKAETVAEK